MTSPVTSSPVLSVIVPAPERLALVERIVRTLGQQRLASQMELVVVAEHPEPALPAELTAPFGWIQVVPQPNWTTMTDARVAGIWHARAPIVAICEDHCFPVAGWAEALVAAHHGPWAAVGPAILNANPATRVSWANLGIEYGPWLHPVAPGACAHVPGHNSSYKRAALVEYGDRLSTMLEAESVLHWDLQRRGYAVALEPAARTRHQNFSRFRPSILLRFCSGRIFAASRAQGWPLWRRMLYSGGSVVLPVVRTWRTLGHLRRVGDSRPRRGLGLVVFTLLCVDAAGESVGYAFGQGRQSQRLSAIEHNRGRFMSHRDELASNG
jgi:hypothetical protein